MVLTRRKLLVTGSSLGVATLLFGCDQGGTPPAAMQVDPVEPAPDAPAAGGDVALLDGSQVEPSSSDPLMNPDGLPDRPIGGADASVVLIEYVSPTCPHCANFHATVFPRLKEQYIDTGEIQFIARPFIRNVLDAVVFMLAEASDTAYYDILGTYMDTQNQWAAAENPRQAIFAIAQQFGFTQERFEEILTDQELFAALESAREQALNEFNLTGTPTFFINGKQLGGGTTFEQMSAEIDALL